MCIKYRRLAITYRRRTSINSVAIAWRSAHLSSLIGKIRRRRVLINMQLYILLTSLVSMIVLVIDAWIIPQYTTKSMFTINTKINNSASSNHSDVLQSRSSRRHRKINSSGKHHNHNVVLQSSHQSSHSRREALKKAFYLAPIIEVAIQPVETANALPQCNPKLHNCIDVIWTPPSSLTKPSEVATAIRDVISTYP